MEKVPACGHYGVEIDATENLADPHALHGVRIGGGIRPIAFRLEASSRALIEGAGAIHDDAEQVDTVR